MASKDINNQSAEELQQHNTHTATVENCRADRTRRNRDTQDRPAQSIVNA
jgi:hypothetical protein